MQFTVKNIVVIFSIVFVFSNAYAEYEMDEVTLEKFKECEYPSNKPRIPNGGSATEEEMHTANKLVKRYMKKGNDYLLCIENLEAEWGETITPEQKNIALALHNKVVDEMQAIADLFNSSLRIYKSKQ